MPGGLLRRRFAHSGRFHSDRLLAGGGSALGFSAQEALAAVNRASLGRFEGNRGLAAALRALRGGFGFRKTGSRRTLALGLAGLAPLGLILEILVVEEVLFSRCEYKIRAAIHAFENAVLKLRHGLFPVDTLSNLLASGGAIWPRLKLYPGFWFAIRLPGVTSSGFVCGPRPA